MTVITSMQNCPVQHQKSNTFPFAQPASGNDTQNQRCLVIVVHVERSLFQHQGSHKKGKLRCTKAQHDEPDCAIQLPAETPRFALQHPGHLF